MKLFVEGGGRTVEVDVREAPGGNYVVRVGDVEQTVDYYQTSAHEASLVIAGRAATYWFEERNGSLLVNDGSEFFRLRVQDERSRIEEEIFGHKREGRGGQDIRSVMPGIVTRVFVGEGDTVSAGTPLLTVEAMKMENEIRAEGAGVVRRIHVGPGSRVNAGDRLVEIAPPETGGAGG